MSEGRFKQLTVEDLDAEQKPLAEKILKVSSLGIGGPYNPLLRSPVLGQVYFDLFKYLRWNSALPMRFCCSLTRRRHSSASRAAHSRSASAIGMIGSG